MASAMHFQMSFLVMIVYLIGPSESSKYYVGGKDGWSSNLLNLSTTGLQKTGFKSMILSVIFSSISVFLSNAKYTKRFTKMTGFDFAVFRYKNGTDSVLQVSQDDYNTCNTTNSILTLENTGNSSTFDLSHSGLFFFISGDSDKCNKGQKLIILVMAPRHAFPTPAPSPSPVQGSSPDISPATSSVPSEAASPFPQGPSQAPSPDDGKSASAPALGGDLVILTVLLFWIIMN